MLKFGQSGSGAPRFEDGRVIASRAWKQLSPYETHWTPYQRKEFGQAQQVNASLVEQAAQRKEQRRQEKLARSEPYNPWGQGYGNRGFGESYQRHKLNDIINGPNIDHQFKTPTDAGGGGEPIRSQDGPVVRRGGKHVDILPELGAAQTEMTHFPNPASGHRANPHKIPKRERLKIEARQHHTTMDEWMDRLETGKPQLEDGYIIGRRNVKTDATRKLDQGKLNQILPLKELPEPNYEARSSKRPKLWKFNENSSEFLAMIR